MTYDEMIKVIQAVKEGKQIQYFTGGVWKDSTTPIFNFGDFEYRIKPESRKPRTLYAAYDKEGVYFGAHCSKDYLEYNFRECGFGEIVEFVEVLKDPEVIKE